METVIRKDVNRGLLALFVTSIIIFSGITVFADSKFQDVSAEYRKAKQNLDSVTARLLQEESRMEDLSTVQERVQKDKTELEEQYSSLKQEIADITQEKDVYILELVDANKEIDDKEGEIDKLQDQLVSLQKELRKSDDRIDNLNDDKDILCQLLEDTGYIPEEC